MGKGIKEKTTIIEKPKEDNSEKETEEVKENPLLKNGYIAGPREIKKMKFVKIEEEKVNV